jgi:membrane-bound lytic murein transglycosylase D
MNFHQKTTTFLLSAASLLCIVLFFIRASHTEKDKQDEEFQQYYKIYSLNLPDSLVFAGETVPMNDFDVKERYDRELLTNVYWQSQTLLMMKRANRFFPAISKILRKNGVPEDFKYIVVAESGLQNVVSPAGAAGYWQFLEKTGRVHGLEITEEVDERYHVERATEAACSYFKEAYREFNNWALVAASYNMGIEGVKKQLLMQGVNNYYDLYLNTETSRYILRILSFKEIMEHPQQFGFRLIPAHLYYEIPSVQIKVDKTIPDLAKFAADNGSNLKMLKLLNPWLRKPFLTVAGSKVYYISLPTNIIANIVNDTIPVEETNFNKTENESINVFEHIIDQNETLEMIAKKYNVSVDDLKKWNGLTTPELKKGDKLIIHKNIKE